MVCVAGAAPARVIVALALGNLGRLGNNLLVGALRGRLARVTDVGGACWFAFMLR